MPMNVYLSDPTAVAQYLKNKGLTGVQGFVSLSLVLTYNTWLIWLVVCYLYDTIGDLHWKTDRQAASLI